jgi:hypothetical protein
LNSQAARILPGGLFSVWQGVAASRCRDFLRHKHRRSAAAPPDQPVNKKQASCPVMAPGLHSGAGILPAAILPPPFFLALPPPTTAPLATLSPTTEFALQKPRSNPAKYPNIQQLSSRLQYNSLKSNALKNFQNLKNKFKLMKKNR